MPSEVLANIGKKPRSGERMKPGRMERCRDRKIKGCCKEKDVVQCKRG